MAHADTVKLQRYTKIETVIPGNLSRHVMHFRFAGMLSESGTEPSLKERVADEIVALQLYPLGM